VGKTKHEAQRNANPLAGIEAPVRRRTATARNATLIHHTTARRKPENWANRAVQTLREKRWELLEMQAMAVPPAPTRKKELRGIWYGPRSSCHTPGLHKTRWKNQEDK